MLSLYEILKASKTGIAPDMWTALAGMNWSGAGSGAETKELTGIPPLSIRSNGTMLLDYLISGNMSQTGAPTPQNPIQPQECGERTGNLWNAIKYSYTSLSDSSVWVYSSSLTGSVYRVPCTPNTKYTLYLAENVSISIWRICEVSTDVVPNASSTAVPTTGAYATSVPASKSATFTTSASAQYILFQTNETAYDSVLPVIMLIEGTSKIPYEPYGYKIPISSASTTTPVYLGEVETTRKIKKLVLTGLEEGWASTTMGTNDYIFRLELSDLPMSGVAPISSHYNGTNATTWVGITNYNVTTSILNSVAIRHSGLTGVSDWKTYLQQQYAAGTPVTVWYVLATETTGIVNEPLRKIGDYADTLSYEQAGVQIPTLHGNTVIDVETTLKPSEMYIKYQE